MAEKKKKREKEGKMKAMHSKHLSTQSLKERKEAVLKKI